MTSWNRFTLCWPCLVLYCAVDNSPVSCTGAVSDETGKVSATCDCALLCATVYCRERLHPDFGAVDDETGKFSSDMRLCFAHPFPATKIMFMPDKESNRPDLLATTADYLRLWHLTEDGVVLQKLLNNVRMKPKHCCCRIRTQYISACSCVTCLAEAAAWLA